MWKRKGRGHQGCAGGEARGERGWSGLRVIRGLNGGRFMAGVWPRGEAEGCDANVASASLHRLIIISAPLPCALRCSPCSCSPPA